MTGAELFVLLAVAGVILIALEILIPGGVAGFIGFLCLLAAAITSFSAFGSTTGSLVTLGLIVGSIAAIMLWLRYIPTSRLGRALTLSDSGADFKSSDEHPELLGQEGEAATDLGPSGMARLDGRRIDVVADGQYINAGERIRVVEVSGNRIVVRRAS